MNKFKFLVIFILTDLLFSQDTVPIKILYGHFSGINTLVYSEKYKLLISGSKDETIKIWDINNFNVISTYTIQGSSIKKILLNHENNHLVVSNYRNIYLFYFPKMKRIKKRNKFHDAYIESLEFGLNEKILISSSWRGITIKSLEFPSFKKRRLFSEQNWTDCLLTYSDSMLLAGSHDNLIKEWNLKNYQLNGIYKGHSDWVYDMEIDPDSLLLYSCSMDRSVIIWNIKTKTIINVIKGFDNPLLKLCLIRNKKYLVAGDTEGKLYVIDLFNQKIIKSWYSHENQINDMIIIKHGNETFLVTGSLDKTIKIWKI
jgi:WD40 repeat protein